MTFKIESGATCYFSPSVQVQFFEMNYSTALNNSYNNEEYLSLPTGQFQGSSADSLFYSVEGNCKIISQNEVSGNASSHNELVQDRVRKVDNNNSLLPEPEMASSEEPQAQLVPINTAVSIVYHDLSQGLQAYALSSDLDAHIYMC